MARGAELRRRHEASLEAILCDGIAQDIFRGVQSRPTVKLKFSALNAIPSWWGPEGSLLLRKLAFELALGGVPA